MPDGPAALAEPTWLTGGLTRTVSADPDNPPKVILTEDNATSQHVIYITASGMGPSLRTKCYMRAGTRRHVQIVAMIGAAPNWAGVNVDTQAWTISHQATGVGTSIINSATLTDIANGDWLLELSTTHAAAGVNYTDIHGSTAGNDTAYTLAYVGNSSTMIFRRVDVETYTPPLGPLTLGAGTVTKAATTGTTLTGTTTHTPAGTACVIRYICRTTVTQAHNPITATFQGVAVTFPTGSQAMVAGTINRTIMGVGYVTGLTAGNPGSLAITCNRALGQMVARVDDVSGLTAAHIGAAFANNYAGTTKTSHDVPVTVTAGSSVLLGIVGGVSGSIDPLTVGGGFTEQAEDVTGTNATTDVAAAFGTKTGGVASTVETMTATSATSIIPWGGAVLELKTA